MDDDSEFTMYVLAEIERIAREEAEEKRLRSDKPEATHNEGTKTNA